MARPPGGLTLHGADGVDHVLTVDAKGHLQLDGGSTLAGLGIVRKFAFAFNTAGILTGATVYTPTVGDLLLDAWIEIDTVWDGTTPLADIGTFVGPHTGLFAWTGAGAVDVKTAANAEAAGTGVLLAPANDGKTHLAQNGAGAAKFTVANPLKICVSQNGANNGADPGSTVGAATLYLVTATPA